MMPGPFSGRIRLCAALLAAVVATTPALAMKPPAKKKAPKAAAGKEAATRATVLAVVNRFEAAYKNRDKETLLLKLMVPVPTTDMATLEKRYQWLRGYGPNDLPGSAHPPILFDLRKGSFAPDSYKVLASAPIDAMHYAVTVREEGTYQDEDGHYKVMRVRHFKMTDYKGKWYVMDYYMQENPEDYGFFVDDITDKMTRI
jgi:hypothetical protein